MIPKKSSLYMVWRQSIDSSCREMYRFLEKNTAQIMKLSVGTNLILTLVKTDIVKRRMTRRNGLLQVTMHVCGFLSTMAVFTWIQMLKCCSRLTGFLELQAFSGFEAEDRLPTGLMASCSRHPFFEKLLHDYEDRSFLKPNGAFDLSTNVEAITKACVDAGLMLNNTEQTVEGFTLFPSEFFCPKDWLTKDIHLTENSYAIHHFDGSWVSGGTKLKHKLMRTLGPKGVKAVKMILRG